MEREGIYVGNKEVTQRYIGNRLVWEKLNLLFSGSVNILYQAANRTVSILGQELNAENVKSIEINGQQISIASAKKGINVTELKFVGGSTEFEKKTNFKRSTFFYQNIEIKVYGG